MQNAFNTSASSLEQAEKLLEKEHYHNYQKRADGTIVLQGNLDISHRGYHELPDLSCVIVTGSFYCQDNFLTSLKGAPREVQDGFWCYNNQLTSLEYTPRGITGQFVCSDNELTSLQYAPAEITGDFACAGNRLSSLEHAPKKFFSLQTDFGRFDKWDDVPELLRTSAETKAVMAQDAVVLKGNMQVSKPLALKKPSA
jgi:hypothetical protein